MSDLDFTLTLERGQNYEFRTDLVQPGGRALVVDEAPPLGRGAGPNPARMLGAAIGHCLSASLLFCMGKARIPVGGMRSTVAGSLVRNERGRLRVGRVDVLLQPEIAREDAGRIARCLEVFEDFCIVTQSVRAGIDVSVKVEPVVLESPDLLDSILALQRAS
jgi:organic hydroperoxide reductase OsmC/OhrA